MVNDTERYEKLNMDSSVTSLRGVGEVKAAALSKMGIFTVGDLLCCYPRAYQNRGDTVLLSEIKKRLCDGETGPFSVILTVSTRPKLSMVRRGMTLLKVRAFDESGSVDITYFNQDYLKDKLLTGAVFRFFGKFTIDDYGLKVINPITEPYSENISLQSIVPVYPLSSGLTQRTMSMLISDSMRICGNELTEYIPVEALAELKLPSLYYTITNIHHPESMSALEAAKRRLVFDELYLMFLSLAISGSKLRKKNILPVKLKKSDYTSFTSSLPFELTDAQKKAVGEILSDMRGEALMNRILTGDVGSGKTVVAAAAIYAAVKSGYRAALMVPTEILAVQHYNDLSKLFGKLGIRCALLTGSVKKKERDRIISGLSDTGEQTLISDNRIDVVIGTHALITDDISVDDLGLAVIDEQHRFGVAQRAALFEKASNVHCLVMSATPIPRTLTLASYGSIDVSRIDTLPAGRQKIDTFIVNESYRERLNGFIRKQASEGHQVYVVCPAVEETEAENEAEAGNSPEELADVPFIEGWRDTTVPLKAATSVAEYLAEALPELSVGFVHGKLKQSAREAVMSEFAAGKLDVLVSTTVIEVGVNVPNATLMIVENAERFGLSQLHQLRGRVGRGSAKSYFILVSDTKSEVARERLSVIKNTSDGFKIAEHDLEMRGPGDFIGENGVIRQHGQMVFSLAASCRDKNLIERASYYAGITAEDDPELIKNNNQQARSRLKRVIDKNDSLKN